ncbi:MAG: CDP-alcohol phosphatidyltransferase family protein [Spirochaetales bacterium]|nr:CDP-alcohol phosphatidyltransferase family protein [Spirochaetales bacterium]
MIDTRLRHYVQAAFDFMAKPFVALRITPNQMTIAAGLFGLAGCVVLLMGFPGSLGIVFLLGLISALLDILDGTVARLTGKSSPLGAFLDLMLDRIVEVCFIMAFALRFPQTHWPGTVFLALVIVNFSAFLLAGSLFKNTGKKSMHYEDGLVERTETFLLFTLMLIFPKAAPIFIWAFNALMMYTAYRRITRIVAHTNTEEEDSSPSNPPKSSSSKKQAPQKAPTEQPEAQGENE